MSHTRDTADFGVLFTIYAIADPDSEEHAATASEAVAAAIRMLVRSDKPSPGIHVRMSKAVSPEERQALRAASKVYNITVV
jgi:hypothetical protein